MKITKQWQVPKPPLALGLTIELSMIEAHKLYWDLNEETALGPNGYRFLVQLREGISASA